MTDFVQFDIRADLVDGIERVANAWGVSVDYIVELILRCPDRVVWRTLSNLRVAPRKVLKVYSEGSKHVAVTADPVLCSCCMGGCRHTFRWRGVVRCGCDASVNARGVVR